MPNGIVRKQCIPHSFPNNFLLNICITFHYMLSCIYFIDLHLLHNISYNAVTHCRSLCLACLCRGEAWIVLLCVCVLSFAYNLYGFGFRSVLEFFSSVVVVLLYGTCNSIRSYVNDTIIWWWGRGGRDVLRRDFGLGGGRSDIRIITNSCTIWLHNWG